MSSFKSGSGDLNFGEVENDEKKASTETAESEKSSHTPSEESKSKSSQTSHSEQSSDQPDVTAKYPYFVRRGAVGDERDNRLELFVRDKVTELEAMFRSELAEELEVDEISKTDAREFALLAAYQNPEHIAECMRKEGFGELN